MWGSAYCFKITVHLILAELCPFENSVNFLFPAYSFCSLHPIKILTLWCGAVHIISRLQYTKYYQSYAPLKISINFSFLANSFYSLHPIKLKIDLLLDHGVEQHILFQGYSTSNIKRVMPLWKFLWTFCFRPTPIVYIQSSWNFVNS